MVVLRKEKAQKKSMTPGKKLKRKSQGLQEVTAEDMELKEEDTKKKMMTPAKKMKRKSQNLQEFTGKEMEHKEETKKKLMTSAKKIKRKSQKLEKQKVSEQEMDQEDIYDTKVPANKRKNASISDVDDYYSEGIREEPQEDDDIKVDSDTDEEGDDDSNDDLVPADNLEGKSNKKRKVPSDVESSPKKAKTYGRETDQVCRTLYCQNIDQAASEKDVAELFDGVKEVRMPRNIHKNRHKGYGFVEFETEELRNAAFEKKDEFVLNGRNLTIRPASTNYLKSDEIKKTENATCVFENLPLEVTPQLFDQFLKEKNLKVLDYRFPRAGGHVYVDVSSENVDQTLSLNDTEWMGNKIVVHICKTYPKAPTLRHCRTIYCPNIPTSDVSEKDVAELFDGVKQVRFPRHPNDDLKGCGYIEFKSEELRDAVLAKKDHCLKGQRLVLYAAREPEELKQIKKAKRKSTVTDSKKTFVVALTEDMVKKSILRNYRGAVNVNIPVNRDGRNNIFAIVEFASAQDAHAVYTRGNKTGAAYNRNTTHVTGTTAEKPIKKLVILDIGDITKEDIKETFEGVTNVFFKGESKDRKAIVDFDTMKNVLDAHRIGQSGVKINGKALRFHLGGRR